MILTEEKNLHLEHLEDEIINQIDQDAIWAEEQSDPDDPMKNLYVDENVFENDLKTIDNDVFPIKQTLGAFTAAENTAIFFDGNTISGFPGRL